jgi:large subunit ribosomal protein L32e
LTEKPKPNNKALRIRRMVKSKKPNFVRYESWRYVRLGKAWKKQIGLDNKARLKLKGWEVSPRIGFRGPREARNLHPSGYKEMIVYNLKNLEKVDPKLYAIRISHQVGTRKRMLILGKAEELGLKVLNPIAEVTLPPSKTEITEEEETKEISKGKETEGKEPEKKEQEKREAKKEPEKKKAKKQEKGEEKREQAKKEKQVTKITPKKSSKTAEKGKKDETKTKKKGRESE